MNAVNDYDVTNTDLVIPVKTNMSDCFSVEFTVVEQQQKKTVFVPLLMQSSLNKSVMLKCQSYREKPFYTFKGTDTEKVLPISIFLTVFRNKFNEVETESDDISKHIESPYYNEE